MSGELSLFLPCLVPFSPAPVMPVVFEAKGDGLGDGLALLRVCGLGSEAFPPECFCLCPHPSVFLLLEDGS